MQTLNATRDLKVMSPTASFRRPQGVVDAERLATHEGDTALFKDLRAALRHREEQLDELREAMRADQSIIADLTAEVRELSAHPTLTLAKTFDNLATPYAEIAAFCSGLRAAGSEPVMEWHGKPDGQVWLCISVIDGEAA